MASPLLTPKLTQWDALRLRAARCRSALLTVRLVLDPLGNLVGFVVDGEPERVEGWHAAEELRGSDKPN